MEYQITWISGDKIGSNTSEELNKEGAKGWVLVGVVPFNDGAKLFWSRTTVKKSKE